MTEEMYMCDQELTKIAKIIDESRNQLPEGKKNESRYLMLEPTDYPALFSSHQISNKRPKLRKDWANNNRVLMNNPIRGPLDSTQERENNHPSNQSQQ